MSPPIVHLTFFLNIYIKKNNSFLRNEGFQTRMLFSRFFYNLTIWWDPIKTLAPAISWSLYFTCQSCVALARRQGDCKFLLFVWGGRRGSQYTGKKMNWPLLESPLKQQLDAVPVPQFSKKFLDRFSMLHYATLHTDVNTSCPLSFKGSQHFNLFCFFYI